MSGIHPRHAERANISIFPKKGYTRRRRRRTTRVLKSEAAFVHLVLLDVPTRQVVHVAGAVDLHGEARGAERPLLSDKDVEVVVRGVHAGVTLSTERCPEDDEVLGDARVDDVHRTHGAAGIAEHPLGGVGVEGEDGGRVLGSEVGYDVGDDSVDVVWVRLDRVLRESVESFRSEDIPAVLRGINEG